VVFNRVAVLINCNLLKADGRTRHNVVCHVWHVWQLLDLPAVHAIIRQESLEKDWLRASVSTPEPHKPLFQPQNPFQPQNRTNAKAQSSTCKPHPLCKSSRSKP